MLKASQASKAGLPPFIMDFQYKYQLKIVSPGRKVSTICAFFLPEQIAWPGISLPLLYIASVQCRLPGYNKKMLFARWHCKPGHLIFEVQKPIYTMYLMTSVSHFTMGGGSVDRPL